MDSVAGADPVLVDRMIRKHFKKLFEHPRYRNCYIRVYIEANLSHIEANRIAATIKTLVPFGKERLIDVVRRDPAKLDRVGVITTHSTKERWCSELRRCIDAMVVAKEFITCKPGGREAVIAELATQLTKFRKDVIASNKAADKAYDDSRIRFTGKSQGQKDDLASALGINMTHMMLDVYSKPVESLLTKLRAMGKNIQC